MTRVAILGAGSFAIEVLEAIELDGKHEPAGFIVSEGKHLLSATHAGLPVFRMDQMPWPPSAVHLIGGITSTQREPFIMDLTELGFEFATIRHPTAIVSPRATFGPGCFVGAGAIVASNSTLHAHVLLNRGANIGHDVEIAPFVSVGPGATVAGGVTIGAGSYIGVGAVVRDHITIGEGAVIAAGAVVVKSVAPRTLVAGCPARVLREDVTAP